MKEDTFASAIVLLHRWRNERKLRLAASDVELFVLNRYGIDSSAHLVVGQEFTAIELVQAFFYLLPEPYVMVNIVFDEVLGVFLRAAVVAFRSPVNPRL